MPASGNMIPQSTTRMRSSTSRQKQFRPISPSPPRKTILTGGRLITLRLAAHTYSNSVVYTYEPLRVVASLTDYFDDGIDSDVASLVTYWNDSAGPNAAPGAVPKLLTNKQGVAAYQALRARIPAAIRPKCEPNRNSFENLYVAAEIECEHPSPGVWKVRYTSYQDEAGFAAAYDEDGFLALRQDETNTSCPESGTWRAKGATRGRYACTVDRDNSYLLWTLDRDRIVAYAYAQVGDMDTADFIEWWNDDAGPRL